MAADLGTVHLGTLTGTLVLRLDDGSEVEMGRVSFPLDVHVGVTMPARSAAQREQDAEADRREADEPEPEPPAPAPLNRERIDALPVGSVIRDRDGDLYDRRSDGWYRTTRFGEPYREVAYGMLLKGFEPYTLVSTPPQSPPR